MKGPRSPLLLGVLLVAGVAWALGHTDDQRATPDAAKAAIDSGDFERALALVEELLLDQRIQRAAVELEEQGPEAAWRVLQSALEIAPAAPAALALRDRLAVPLLEASRRSFPSPSSSRAWPAAAAPASRRRRTWPPSGWNPAT